MMNDRKPWVEKLMPQHERIIEYCGYRFKLFSRIKQKVSDNDVQIVKDVIDYLRHIEQLPDIIIYVWIDDKNSGCYNFQIINEAGKPCPYPIDDISKASTHFWDELGTVGAYFSGFEFELPKSKYNKYSDYYSTVDALSTEYSEFLSKIEKLSIDEAWDLYHKHLIGY